MSVEHKQHCPPRTKCPEFGEKGSRRTYASSKSLEFKKKNHAMQFTDLFMLFFKVCFDTCGLKTGLYGKCCRILLVHKLEQC